MASKPLDELREAQSLLDEAIAEITSAHYALFVVFGETPTVRRLNSALFDLVAVKSKMSEGVTGMVDDQYNAAIKATGNMLSAALAAAEKAKN